MGIRPSTLKRHLADLRARSGLTTEQLTYSGRVAGWLVVQALEPDRSTIDIRARLPRMSLIATPAATARQAEP